MKADRLSLDEKQTEVRENDIPDMIARFKKREMEKDRKRNMCPWNICQHLRLWRNQEAGDTDRARAGDVIRRS